MDLDITMRFVMTQVVKAANDKDICIEHVFGGILMLSSTALAEVSPDVRQQSIVKAIQTEVQKILEERGVTQPQSLLTQLNSLLELKPRQANRDVASLLAKAILESEQEGKEEVDAVKMLKVILQEPTALIAEAINTYRINPEQKEPILKKEEEIVFFEIPKASPAMKAKVSPQRVQPQARIVKPQFQKANKPMVGKKEKVTIMGYVIKGNVVWAAIKYFLLVTIIPALFLYFAEHQWQAVSAPSNKYWERLPLAIVFLSSILVAYGIINFISIRFKIFAVYLFFIVSNITLMIVAYYNLKLRELTDFPIYDRIAICFVAFFILFYSFNKIFRLKGKVSGENQYMNSLMFRLYGTPSIMFSLYLFRSMIIPLLVFSIIYIFSLTPTSFWRATFWIIGFLIICDIFRMALKSFKEWTTDIKNQKTYFIRSIAYLLYTNYLILIWPVFGWFLMWYFGWLPMKTWVIWIYGIYGFLALWLDLAIIIAIRNNKNK